MSNKISGRGLEKLKDLVEGRSTSLTPKPVWNADPGALIEPPRKKRYDASTYMDDLIEDSDYDPLEYFNK